MCGFPLALCYCRPHIFWCHAPGRSKFEHNVQALSTRWTLLTKAKTQGDESWDILTHIQFLVWSHSCVDILYTIVRRCWTFYVACKSTDMSEHVFWWAVQGQLRDSALYDIVLQYGRRNFRDRVAIPFLQPCTLMGTCAILWHIPSPPFLLATFGILIFCQDRVPTSRKAPHAPARTPAPAHAADIFSNGEIAGRFFRFSEIPSEWLSRCGELAGR